MPFRHGNDLGEALQILEEVCGRRKETQQKQAQLCYFQKEGTDYPSSGNSALKHHETNWEEHNKQSEAECPLSDHPEDSPRLEFKILKRRSFLLANQEELRKEPYSKLCWKIYLSLRLLRLLVGRCL